MDKSIRLEFRIHIRRGGREFKSPPRYKGFPKGRPFLLIGFYMYTVYILYSFVHDRTYTGYTTDLIQRFYSHNKYNNTDWTKKYRPWVVIHFEVFEEKKEAIKREQQLKSGKGRDWIKANFNEWIKVFG